MSAASAGLTPRPPSSAAAPAVARPARKKSRRLGAGESISSFMDWFLPKLSVVNNFTTRQDPFWLPALDHGPCRHHDRASSTETRDSRGHATYSMPLASAAAPEL